MTKFPPILFCMVLLVALAVAEESGSSSSGENKRILVRRKIIKKRIDGRSKESDEASPLPKSTDFTEKRRMVYNRLKNHPINSKNSFSKLRSRLGRITHAKKLVRRLKKTPKVTTIASTTISGSLSTTTEKGSQNESMLMIPVPESQRKPYQPVIMQVEKKNVTSGVTPASVTTYKLNKMFVPMGIYGKVVRKNETERKSKGMEDKVDLTYDYKVDVNKVSLTTEAMDVMNISLTTEGPDVGPDEGHRRSGNSKNKKKNPLQSMNPPSPLLAPTYNQGSSFLSTLRQTASNIPGLFHKGFTSLASFSQTPNMFQDNEHSASNIYSQAYKNKNSQILAAVPGGMPPRDVYQEPSQVAAESVQQQVKQRPQKVKGHGQRYSYNNANGFKPIVKHSIFNDWRKFFNLPLSKEESYGNYGPTTFGSGFGMSGARRRSLDLRWNEIRRKYSDNQLRMAKEKIYEMYRTDNYEHDSNVISDLLSMFEMVLNFGKGRSVEPMQNYAHIGHVNQHSRNGGSDEDSWVPISKESGRPLISFSAGVSFPSPQHSLRRQYQKLQSKPKQRSYLSNEISSVASQYDTAAAEIESYQDAMKMSASSSPDPEDSYELVPSDEYFKNGAPLGEIAAVVKPVGVDDQLIQASLPKGVPTIEYKNPNTLYSAVNSALKLNKQRAQTYKVKEESFVLPEEYYKSKYAKPVMHNRADHTTQGITFTDLSFPEGTDPDIADLVRAELLKSPVSAPRVHAPLDSSSMQPPELDLESLLIQKAISGSSRASDNILASSQRVPTHSSLSMQTKQSAIDALSPAKIALNQISSHSTKKTEEEPRRRTPITKFFAPIPISPTIMTQTLKGRYQSPVPRYVVELAKKLKKDKSVQGIVRVSTRRANGPPVEYLYPSADSMQKVLPLVLM